MLNTFKSMFTNESNLNKKYLHIDEIELDYEPREQIIPMVPQLSGEPEMSIFESAFLCGILNKFMPQKICEVGIAGGGSTAIILQCMANNQRFFEMHSVDYSEQFYRDKSLPSGYIGGEAKKIINYKNYKHEFHLGSVACAFRAEIGDNIDCLILDTVHIAPAEVIEFITLLPQLKDGCVVVLHDIIFSHICKYKDKFRYATPLLLSAVTGHKYFNYDSSRKAAMPNIAAFVVDSETKKNIVDVFLSLIVTWNFMPYGNQLREYRKVISEYYSDECLKIYDAAVSMNKDTYYVRFAKYAFPFAAITKKCEIVISGKEPIASEFVNQLIKRTDIKTVLLVLEDSNAENSIKDVIYDYIILALESEEEAQKANHRLQSIGIPIEKIIWRDPVQKDN